MKQIIKIHGNEWMLEDLQEDIDWCNNQKWELKTYNDNNNHAHCSICWWAIGVSSDPDVGEAYFVNENHWLCKECHEKFLEKKV